MGVIYSYSPVVDREKDTYLCSPRKEEVGRSQEIRMGCLISVRQFMDEEVGPREPFLHWVSPGFGPKITFTNAAPGTALAEYISLQDEFPHLSL
jgi:hypothetical protein